MWYAETQGRPRCKPRLCGLCSSSGFYSQSRWRRGCWCSEMGCQWERLAHVPQSTGRNHVICHRYVRMTVLRCGNLWLKNHNLSCVAGYRENNLFVTLNGLELRRRLAPSQVTGADNGNSHKIPAKSDSCAGLRGLPEAKKGRVNLVGQYRFREDQEVFGRDEAPRLPVGGRAGRLQTGDGTDPGGTAQLCQKVVYGRYDFHHAS